MEFVDINRGNYRLKIYSQNSNFNTASFLKKGSVASKKIIQGYVAQNRKCIWHSSQKNIPVNAIKGDVWKTLDIPFLLGNDLATQLKSVNKITRTRPQNSEQTPPEESSTRQTSHGQYAIHYFLFSTKNDNLRFGYINYKTFSAPVFRK